MTTRKCAICDRRFKPPQYLLETADQYLCFKCRTFSQWLIRHCGTLEKAAEVVEGVRQGISTKTIQQVIPN